MKNYPLNPSVNRDGDGNVIEIVTKELVSRRVSVLSMVRAIVLEKTKPNEVMAESGVIGQVGDQAWKYARA